MIDSSPEVRQELEFLQADLELLRQEVDYIKVHMRQLKMSPATMATILKGLLENK